MQIQIDGALIVQVLGGAFTVTALSVITRYFRNINKELIDQRVRNAEVKAMVDNHASQLRDLWTKFGSVDKTHEEIHKQISAIDERTKLNHNRVGSI